MLRTRFKHHLHANTDSQHVPTRAQSLVNQRFSAEVPELFHYRGVGADPRQKHSVRLKGNPAVLGQNYLSPSFFERSTGGMDIAAAIVQHSDCFTQRAPFVDGTPRTRGSLSTALRSALAKALN